MTAAEWRELSDAAPPPPAHERYMPPRITDLPVVVDDVEALKRRRAAEATVRADLSRLS